MNAGSAIVRSLESLGVDTVFGGTGEANAAMMLELNRSKRIRTVIVRNEQAASFMACGYAMFSGRLGVCFSTAGPGEFNLFSGLALALSDSLPVLGISGYTIGRFRGKGALNESTGLHRTPDAVAMTSATTKGSFVIEDPTETCDVVETAVNLAFEGRPGPVHIHVPTDILRADAAFREIRVVATPPVATPRKITQFADVLEQAIREGRKSVVIAGYGAVRSGAQTEVRELVERYQIPLIATMDAKGILPMDHPLYLGGLGTAGDPGAERYFGEAQLVLALGNSFAQNATYGFRKDLFDDKVLMHVNIDREEIGKVYEPDYFMVSDVKPALASVLRELSGKVGAVPALALRHDRLCDREVPSADRAIHPVHLAREISRLLPKDAIVLGDAGGHMLWLNCFLRLTDGQIFQNPGSFGPMASHVNGAIGVKCAHPDRAVVVGCGDGAYLMAGFELLTAVRYRIPVIWIIFNNGEFNVIKQFQDMQFGEHAFVDFQNPDYVAYAKACGARGWRVERLEDLAPAFAEALVAQAPALIDVAVAADVFPPYHSHE
jgi:acetolactate synthase-1/2/3 large subunit